jgi:hypothetical protein
MQKQLAPARPRATFCPNESGPPSFLGTLDPIPATENTTAHRMNFTLPTAYHRSFRFAMVVQLLAVLLSAGVDDDGSFMVVVVVAWAFFWIGVLALAKFRPSPSPTELVGLRYGPLAIFILAFTIGQYL